MANAFRLKSSTMFLREDDDINEPPLRIVFLSVEGNKTEIQYFEYIEKFRKSIGINASVHVHPLHRAKRDNLSAPENIIELLEEYLLLRNKDNLPERLKNAIPQEYTDDFIKKYLNSELESNKETEAFEQILVEAGFDVAYSNFLKEYKGKEDAFGIIIDRDYKSHSVSQMLKLVEECNQKGYKLYVSNPLFEFWLLLHLVDIEDLSEGVRNSIRDNNYVSDKHTYTSKMVSDIAGHTKSIGKKTFEKYYLPNIDKAIIQSKSLETNIYKLIGSDEDFDKSKGAIGSNIFELFELLKSASR